MQQLNNFIELHYNASCMEDFSENYKEMSNEDRQN